MVKAPAITGAVEQAVRDAAAALPPGSADRHIPELRVRVPPGATPAQIAAAARTAIRASFGGDR